MSHVLIPTPFRPNKAKYSRVSLYNFSPQTFYIVYLCLFFSQFAVTLFDTFFFFFLGKLLGVSDETNFISIYQQ